MLLGSLTRNPLPKIEKSTVNYLRKYPLGTATEIYPAEPVRRLPHPFISAKDKIELSEPARLFELKDIDFWARYGGSVRTAANHLLADLSPEVWGVENHPIFSTIQLPRPQRLEGRTAICVTPEAPGNYYHWLIDLLPRVALVLNARGKFDRLLLNGAHAPYEEASLRMLGLSDQILYVDARHRFFALNAIIPSMDHRSSIVAPWKIRILREMRDALAGIGHDRMSRIYISRQRAAVRRVCNESDLRPLLEQSGFKFVELESVPWNEQLNLFSNADIIVAPHGAALANIAFCRPNTLIVEIGTSAGYRDFYWRLAASASLRYRFVEAQLGLEGPPSALRALENEDMIVDKQMLEEVLDQL
jgi:hypothetical protein